jgi:hypothetical protein
MARLALVMLGGAVLAACAGPTPRGEDEIDRLMAECRAKGGILVPRPGPPVSGNERANQICEIRSATRIPRS